MKIEKNLATNLVISQNYNFNQYFFIRCEFSQIYRWISFSFYIIYICTISTRSKIKNYIINQNFKFQLITIFIFYFLFFIFYFFYFRVGWRKKRKYYRSEEDKTSLLSRLTILNSLSY